MSNLKVFIKAILIPVLVGILIGLLTSGSMDYEMLNKPFLSPPRLSISHSLDYTICFNGSILWNIRNKFSS